MTHFHVGVTVTSLLDLAAFAKQAIGFVKQQHDVLALGRIEQGVQIFFRFADVLANQV